MQVGNNWGGNYSRFTFDEAKRYFYMMKEQGVPVLDEEFNLLQEIQITYLRRFIQDMLGDGSPNNGFNIVGTGANNDFTISGGDNTLDGAGHFYIAGYLIVLPANTTYSAQPMNQPALTTPASARTDTVYLDVYLDEVNPVDDPSMVDPALNVETSRRLQLKWEIKVAENAIDAPPAYTDSNGLSHYIHAVATINRTPTSVISAGMVTDIRRVSRALHGNREGGSLHAPVTQSVSGFMSAADKARLDNIESGATADQTKADIDALNINAATLGNQLASFYRNASNLNAGFIPLNRIPPVLLGKDADTVDGFHGNELVHRSRAILPTPPLTGGGTLADHVRIGIIPATTAVAGSMSATDKRKANAIYAGYISMNAARGFNYIPAGWTVSRGATGVYNLFHNLNINNTFPVRYINVVATPTNQSTNNVTVFATALGSNIVQFVIEDTAGTRKENGLYFMLFASEMAQTNVVY